jgi:hypothetical protein
VDETATGTDLIDTDDPSSSIVEATLQAALELAAEKLAVVQGVRPPDQAAVLFADQEAAIVKAQEAYEAAETTVAALIVDAVSAGQWRLDKLPWELQAAFRHEARNLIVVESAGIAAAGAVT